MGGETGEGSKGLVLESFKCQAQVCGLNPAGDGIHCKGYLVFSVPLFLIMKVIHVPCKKVKHQP